MYTCTHTFLNNSSSFSSMHITLCIDHNYSLLIIVFLVMLLHKPVLLDIASSVSNSREQGDPVTSHPRMTEEALSNWVQGNGWLGLPPFVCTITLTTTVHNHSPQIRLISGIATTLLQCWETHCDTHGKTPAFTNSKTRELFILFYLYLTGKKKVLFYSVT